MNEIFKILDSVCKTKEKLSPDFIEDHWVGGYMVVKWVSFLNIEDKARGVLLGYLSKLASDMFDEKYDEYLYYLNVLPKVKYCNFQYIKKTPKKILKKDTDYEKVLTFVSQSLELSKRECKYFIDEGYINLNNIKKSI